MTLNSAANYKYSVSTHGHHHAYLLPSILSQLSRQSARRIFDLGCGNGSIAAFLASKDFDVIGVDPSVEGVELANRDYPHLRLEQGSAYDDLCATYGTFPVVISLEVVEHVFLPRDYAKTLYALVEPGGMAIISTPYHGYLKNLVLALTGKMDAHFTALWDYGHIKFWSQKTLKTLLVEAGFKNVVFEQVGRVPFLAKSMIAVAQK